MTSDWLPLHTYRQVVTNSDLYIAAFLKSTGLRAHGLLTLGLRVNMIYAACRVCCLGSVLDVVIEFRV